MPVIGKSAGIRQATQILSGGVNLIGGFAEKLYEAEAVNEINANQFTLKASGDDQYLSMRDKLAQNDYSLDDNNRPTIGGKHLEEWVGETSEWYNNQIKWIDQNVKNPKARKALKAQLGQESYNLGVKVKNEFDTKRIDNAGANLESTLGNITLSPASATDRIGQMDSAIRAAITTGTISAQQGQLRFQQGKNTILNNSLADLNTYVQQLGNSNESYENMLAVGQMKLDDLRKNGVDPTILSTQEMNLKNNALIASTYNESFAIAQDQGEEAMRSYVQGKEGLSPAQKATIKNNVSSMIADDNKVKGDTFRNDYQGKAIEIVNQKNTDGTDLTPTQKRDRLVRIKDSAVAEAKSKGISADSSAFVVNQFDALIKAQDIEIQKTNNKEFATTWAPKYQDYVSAIVTGKSKEGDTDYTTLVNDIEDDIQTLLADTKDYGTNIKDEVIDSLRSIQQNAKGKSELLIKEAATKKQAQSLATYQKADTDARSIALSDPKKALLDIDTQIKTLESDPLYADDPQVKEKVRAGLLETRGKIQELDTAQQLITTTNGLYTKQNDITSAILKGDYVGAGNLIGVLEQSLNNATVNGKPLDASQRQSFDNNIANFKVTINQYNEQLAKDADIAADLSRDNKLYKAWDIAYSSVREGKTDAKDILTQFKTEIDASTFKSPADKQKFDKLYYELDKSLAEGTALSGDTEKQFELYRFLRDMDATTDIPASMVQIDAKIAELAGDSRGGYTDSKLAMEAIGALEKAKETLDTRKGQIENNKAEQYYFNKFIALSGMDDLQGAVSQIDELVNELSDPASMRFTGLKAVDNAKAWVSSLQGLKGNIEKILAGTDQQKSYDAEVEKSFTSRIISLGDSVTKDDVETWWNEAYNNPTEINGRKYTPSREVLTNVLGAFDKLQSQASGEKVFETSLAKYVQNGGDRAGALKMINEHIATSPELAIPDLNRYWDYVDTQLPAPAPKDDGAKPNQITTAEFNATLNSMLLSGSSKQDVLNWAAQYSVIPTLAEDYYKAKGYIDKFYQAKINENQLARDKLAMLDKVYAKDPIKDAIKNQFIESLLEGKKDGNKTRPYTQEETNALYKTLTEAPIAKKTAEMVQFTMGGRADLDRPDSQPFDVFNGPAGAASWAGLMGKDKSGELSEKYQALVANVGTELESLLSSEGILPKGAKPMYQQDDNGFWWTYNGIEYKPFTDEQGDVSFMAILKGNRQDIGSAKGRTTSQLVSAKINQEVKTTLEKDATGEGVKTAAEIIQDVTNGSLKLSYKEINKLKVSQYDRNRIAIMTAYKLGEDFDDLLVMYPSIKTDPVQYAEWENYKAMSKGTR